MAAQASFAPGEDGIGEGEASTGDDAVAQLPGINDATALLALSQPLPGECSAGEQACAWV